MKIDDRLSLSLGPYEEEVQQRLAQMAKEDFGSRLWGKDAGLWKQDPKDQKGISGGLGWLHVAETMAGRVKELWEFAREVRQAGIRQVVHMGMGGSSQG